ncbi:MAG TPA: glutathione S-transferase family protein [Cyanophyceae cyanobacterium]
MLTLYHLPVSGNSRRVWIALLEKEIPFEQVLLKLDGDQFKSEFLELNPFHHVPVVVDDGFKVIESLAILDYLEAKYPTPSLMPSDADGIAIARMVQMVTLNELWSPMIWLTGEVLGVVTDKSDQLEKARQQVLTVLRFFENLLNDSPYFGSDRLTLADITAGTMVPQLPSLGVPLDNYPKLTAWSERLMARDSWQKTQPSPEELAAAMPQAQAIIQAHLLGK